MGSYRKKLGIVEAVQLPIKSAPAWLADAMDAGTVRLFTDGTADVGSPGIMTVVGPGDWIIQNAKGELSGCDPQTFTATYDELGFDA